MTAFSSKLDSWQDHMAAVAQRRLDEIAADEALRERIWADDDLLLSAIRRAGQDDILIGDAVDMQFRFMKAQQEA